MEHDEESIIEGHTQAVEFVGQLEKEWREKAEHYRESGYEAEARTYEECAEELESKIEQFANT